MKDYREAVVRDVKAKKDTVIKFLGFKDREPRPVMMKKIDKGLEDFEQYINLSYGYCLNEDEMYADIVYTIGENFEKEIEKLIESGMAFPAMVLDKVGIVTLDMYRKHIMKEIYEVSGLSVKKYVYPGTKTHPVSFQKEIYENVGLDTVKINEYNQLYPVKSVAIRALLHKGESLKEFSPCEGCEAKCEMKGSF
mgnify:FL=1